MAQMRLFEIRFKNGIILSLLALFVAPWALGVEKVNELRGVKSQYTSVILKMAKARSEFESLTAEQVKSVQIECYDTPGNHYYIGAHQRMMIYATLSRVEAVLDDFAHYQNLFPDYKDIHVVSRQGNQVLVSWEQVIPFFFLPNIKYQSIYTIDQSNPKMKTYRYQLKEVGKLKASDGFIRIESEGEGTRYNEVDFFDAEWGLLKTFAPRKIWKESIEGVYLSDMAIKLKAEKPEWGYTRVKQEAKKRLEMEAEDLEKKCLLRRPL